MHVMDTRPESSVMAGLAKTRGFGSIIWKKTAVFRVVSSRELVLRTFGDGLISGGKLVGGPQYQTVNSGQICNEDWSSK